MRVRFGFVAMALSLQNASPSQTMTYKAFQSISDQDAALAKATRIAQSNLVNTLRILRHANASGVKVYRLSSKLIPLFTHEATEGWDVFEQLHDDFLRLGEFIRTHNMRVSFHPDHFVVLNSPRKDVIQNSIRDLRYHVHMFEAMGLDAEAKLVIHVGGAYQDKHSSLERFSKNWSLVPPEVRRRLTLENDDKTFTAVETLSLCDDLSVPMVFDLHHHTCNHAGDVAVTGEPNGSVWSPSQLTHVVGRFLGSWQRETIPPKVHMSSPRDEHNVRAHADEVNPSELIPLLDAVRDFDVDVDVMLEAKRKDEAVFALMRDLKDYDFIRVVDGGTIEYRP